MSKPKTSVAPRSVSPNNPWVRGLYPGVHTPMSGRPVSFTPADVSAHVQAIEAQLAGGYMPPIVLGHPKTDDPRVGSIADVKLGDDGASWYKVDKLTPEFHESCQRGEYLFGSPKIDPKTGGLRHLGALGAWEPALLEQPAWDFGAPPTDLEIQDEDLVFGVPANWGEVTANWLHRITWRLNSLGRIFRNQREAMIADQGIEAADRVLPSYDIESLVDLKVPDTIDPQPKESNGPMAVALAAPAAEEEDPEKQELRNRLAEAERKLAERTTEEVALAFGAAVTKASQEGRLNQVMRQELEKLHAELSGASEAGLAFGAPTDPVPAALVRLVDALPPIVPLGELAFGTPRADSNASNPMLADAKARAERFHQEYR